MTRWCRANKRSSLFIISPASFWFDIDSPLCRKTSPSVSMHNAYFTLNYTEHSQQYFALKFQILFLFYVYFTYFLLAWYFRFDTSHCFCILYVCFLLLFYCFCPLCDCWNLYLCIYPTSFHCTSLLPSFPSFLPLCRSRNYEFYYGHTKTRLTLPVIGLPWNCWRNPNQSESSFLTLSDEGNKY